MRRDASAIRTMATDPRPPIADTRTRVTLASGRSGGMARPREAYVMPHKAQTPWAFVDRNIEADEGRRPGPTTASTGTPASSVE